MNQHLVAFEKMAWVNGCEGMRYKKFEKDGKILRLIELTDCYREEEWCLHGHAAMIVEGVFVVAFEDHTEHFKAGDVVFIPGGRTHQHKASVPNGQKMIMLSFEL